MKEMIKKIYSFIRHKGFFLRLKIRNIGKSSKVIFSEYWERNHWENKESKSGDGSTLEYTENIRREIPLLLDRLNLKIILDIPCGDFNWFKEIKLSNDVSYTGGDIVDGMIYHLNTEFSSNFRKFIAIDAVTGVLPSADIWICRDLIFHLPNKDILMLIDNFLRSDIKWLLITSHTEGDIKNKDTFVGGFRLVNLFRSPFNFPKPSFSIKDYLPGYPERYLLLYSKEILRIGRLDMEIIK